MAREGRKSKGKSGRSSLFKGMGSLFNLISQMAEEGTEELTRSGEIKGLPEKAKGVYGFTIKMGLGGQPTIEQFGNLRETEKGVVVAEVREPLVDVFDEGEFILVIAELPGVAEGDIHVEVKDDILVLTAEGKDRKYAKEILLPALADADAMESTFRNGILEIKLRRK